MGIGLGGSSESYPPLDDTAVLNSVRVMTAHDNEVYGGATIPGAHNLLVGRNVVAGERSQYNTVVGEDVVISAGVQNATSLARRGVVMSESDVFQLGDFLTYREKLGELRVANDMIRVNSRSKDVKLGGAGDLHITPTGTSVLTPMQVRSREVDAQEWEIAVEPSEDDPIARDLVLRASDGTSVVFCSGAPQRHP